MKSAELWNGNFFQCRLGLDSGDGESLVPVVPLATALWLEGARVQKREQLGSLHATHLEVGRKWLKSSHLMKRQSLVFLLINLPRSYGRWMMSETPEMWDRTVGFSEAPWLSRKLFSSYHELRRLPNPFLLQHREVKQRCPQEFSDSGMDSSAE